MEVYGGEALHILNLSTRWRQMVIFTLELLYPQGKLSWYLLDRKLSGSQTFSGCGDKEKNPTSVRK
jgi:hypothetical protein